MADEEVALDAVARDVVDGLRVRLDEVGAEVRIGELPTVQGDPALLHQVLQNLIDNAAKYQRPGPAGRDRRVGRAGGRWHDDDGTPWWRISVRDNGIGIPPSTSRRCSTCSPGPSRAPS